MRLTAALALAAAPAAADCPAGADTLMACSFAGGTKALELCLEGREVRYSYGPAGGAPELALRRDVTEIGYTPWPGVGRAIWEEIVVENAGHRYAVWFSIDRLTDEHPIEGGIVVSRGETELARLDCDRGSVGGGLYGPELEQAMGAAGLEWCWRETRWRPDCG